MRPAAHPLPHVAAAIHRSLPGYAVQDSGRVLDQFTALCTVTVRAQDAAGTTLVVYVVGPDGNPAKTGRSRWQTVVRVDGAMITRSTTLFRGGGWMVRVGTVGPVADQPTTAKLRRVAQDPDLLW